MRRRKLPAILLFLLVGFGCLAQVDETWADETDVPKVRLGQGSIGSFRWQIYVSPERSGNPRRPCIASLSGGPRWGFSEFKSCGPIDPIPTLLGDSSGEGKYQRTVLSMAFSPQVGSVRLWLRGRKSRLVDLKLLGARQAEKVGLNPFRYGIRAFAGQFCLQRFASYDASGDLLDLSERMGCPG